MAIVMVAMLAFGGTYAYFTATATARTASITTGYVKLSSDAAFAVTAENVMPGDKVSVGTGLTLTVDTTDDEGEWVAVKVTIEGAALGIDATSIGSGWTETAEGSNIFVYNSKVANGQTAVAFAEGFTLSKDIQDNWTQGEEASDHELMSATVTIKVESRGIQASNVTADQAKTQLAGLFA